MLALVMTSGAVLLGLSAALWHFTGPLAPTLVARYEYVGRHR